MWRYGLLILIVLFAGVSPAEIRIRVPGRAEISAQVRESIPIWFTANTDGGKARGVARDKTPPVGVIGCREAISRPRLLPDEPPLRDAGSWLPGYEANGREVFRRVRRAAHVPRMNDEPPAS